MRLVFHSSPLSFFSPHVLNSGVLADAFVIVTVHVLKRQILLVEKSTKKLLMLFVQEMCIQMQRPP